ncbi:MAG: energy-coupling factor ABC transporter ATP-binding protein [Actinobacteria bacterium]|nr:energy-coupling factor ABC transporter ATP-binding protein [Actinomycetota bacterium]
MGEHRIQLSDVAVRYDNGCEALRGVSLEFTPGEKVCLVGENGAGKSTIFSLLVGLVKPSSGTYLFDGSKVSGSKMLKTVRKEIGLVFQEPEVQLVANTVFDEVSYGAINLGYSDDEVAHRVMGALEKTGTSPLAQQAVHRLSGGQKKRVTISDVLVCDPSFVLMDEPNASLDPERVSEVLGIADTLAENGVGVIVSTHDVDFALEFANRIIILSKGRVCFDGEPHDAFRNRELLRSAGLREPFVVEFARRYAEEVLGYEDDTISACDIDGLLEWIVKTR